MITFDGKSASFVPGKEVPNKEPPVSKFVVEKLYKVHRERIRDMQPVVDCHVDIPDFLTNQSWKKITEEHRREVIKMHNEVIYQRIAKVENNESAITTENRKHIKHVENELRLMKNLKEKGRVRNVLKIQRENEDLLKRIERARPEYTRKGIKEWYKHHELFKKGRRSDPTAGHLGFRGVKGLRPAALPRHTASNVDLALDAASLRDERSSPTGRSTAPASLRRAGRAPGSRGGGLSLADPHSMASMREASAYGEAFPLSLSPHGHLPNTQGSPQLAHTHHSDHHLHAASENQEDTHTRARADDDDDEGQDEQDEAQGFHVLLSRPFNVPFESKVCIVYILACSRAYDENLYFRATTNTTPPAFLCERPLSIDEAHEIVYSSSTSSILYGASNDDLSSLRGLLVDMFKEADDDGNGYLTFDEFEALMAKVELGISSSELRYVIQEADDNDNGVVDYDEFVPLAVDMIQSFRARNRAKIFCSQRDSMIEEEVVTKMRSLDFESMTAACLDKIKEYDPKKFGMLRVQDLKRALIAVSFAIGLSETEIQLICNKLPTDQFGRTLYNNIGEVLQKVRFISLKLTIIQAQGGELHHTLLELCLLKERLNRSTSDDQTLTGEIPCCDFTEILLACPKIKLSRLQILVLMAEAGGSEHGLCNYQTFLPIVSKTVEYMFEPKALRQRAELIDNSEISSESLTRGMASQDPEAIEKRLRALFDACDYRKEDGLSEDTFTRCLVSLELELTPTEMRAHYSLLHKGPHGGVDWETFRDFFIKNLGQLEKTKHFRILQSRLHRDHTGDSPQSSAEIAAQRDDLLAHLTSLLEMCDTHGSGFIELHELEDVVRGLDLELTPFQLDVVLSEVEHDEHGYVDYHAFLPTCTDLLQTFIVRQYAEVEEHRTEHKAEERAARIVHAARDEIRHIAKSLYNKVQYADTTAQTPEAKLATVQQLLRDPHSGLTRTEANYLVSRLFAAQLVMHEDEATHRMVVDGRVDVHGNKLSGEGIVFIKANKETGEEAEHTLDHFGNPIRINSTAASTTSPKTRVAQSMVYRPSSKQGSASPKPLSRQTWIGSVGSVGSANSMGSANCTQQSMATLDQGRVVLSNPAALAKKATRIMTTDMTHQVFESLVTEARKQSVMRGMMHNMNKTAVYDYLLHATEHKRQDLVTEGKIDAMSIYVPVKVCYSVLEEAPSLRLSRSQVIAIISLSEAFDKTGLLVDYRRFCLNASHVVERLFDSKHQLARANVMDISVSTIDEVLIMNGLTQEDCQFYLEQAFGELSGKHDLVEHEQFLEVVRGIPLVKMAEKDVVTVYAAADHTANDKVHWRPCVDWVYPTVRDILKEKFIARRMALLAAAVIEDADQPHQPAAGGGGVARNDAPESHLSVAEEEALNSLKSLAEKLVDFVKVRQDGPNLRILLPSDKGDYNDADVGSAEKAEVVAEGLEGHSILLVDRPRYSIAVVGRGGKKVKDDDVATEIASMAAGLTSGASFSGAVPPMIRRAPTIRAMPREVVGHLRITAVEKASSVDRDLVMSFTHEQRDIGAAAPAPAPAAALHPAHAAHAHAAGASASAQTCHLQQSIRLPSMCLVDREHAEEFAMQLASRLAIEVQPSGKMSHSLQLMK